jgi:hypothetical protein
VPGFTDLTLIKCNILDQCLLFVDRMIFKFNNNNYICRGALPHGFFSNNNNNYMKKLIKHVDATVSFLLLSRLIDTHNFSSLYMPLFMIPEVFFLMPLYILHIPSILVPLLRI